LKLGEEKFALQVQKDEELGILESFATEQLAIE
jgi:hypothetical protein